MLEDNDISLKWLNLFCRHLVALTGFYQSLDPKGEPIGRAEYFIYPGFVVSIRDVWHWVTAGHTLKQLDAALNKKQIKLIGCSLRDDLGLGATSHTLIPFAYEGAPRVYIDDENEGLDFGLVLLRPYYRGILLANGIVPMSEENWAFQHTIDFDRFCILGFPVELLSEETFSITMIPITKLDQAPENSAHTTFPRFVAKINDECKLENIEGMSGGPVFAFAKGKDDRYWIIALQSRWLPDSRVIFACPVAVFAALVEEAIGKEETN